MGRRHKGLAFQASSAIVMDARHWMAFEDSQDLVARFLRPHRGAVTMRRVILASIVVLLPSLCRAHPAVSQHVRDLRAGAPVVRQAAPAGLSPYSRTQAPRPRVET